MSSSFLLLTNTISICQPYPSASIITIHPFANHLPLRSIFNLSYFCHYLASIISFSILPPPPPILFHLCLTSSSSFYLCFTYISLCLFYHLFASCICLGPALRGSKGCQVGSKLKINTKTDRISKLFAIVAIWVNLIRNVFLRIKLLHFTNEPATRCYLQRFCKILCSYIHSLLDCWPPYSQFDFMFSHLFLLALFLSLYLY